jgi:hypothetical protein
MFPSVILPNAVVTVASVDLELLVGVVVAVVTGVVVPVVVREIVAVLVGVVVGEVVPVVVAVDVSVVVTEVVVVGVVVAVVVGVVSTTHSVAVCPSNHCHSPSGHGTHRWSDKVLFTLSIFVSRPQWVTL